VHAEDMAPQASQLQSFAAGQNRSIDDLGGDIMRKDVPDLLKNAPAVKTPEPAKP